MKQKFTKLEKELLEILDGMTFYSSGHDKFCAKTWNHDNRLTCTCKRGKYLIHANIVLNKFGMGYHQEEIDKIMPE